MYSTVILRKKSLRAFFCLCGFYARFYLGFFQLLSWFFWVFKLDFYPLFEKFLDEILGYFLENFPLCNITLISREFSISSARVFIPS